MVAIRVGSPESPVKQGDPVPGEPGKFYENGQFSPNIDSLMTSTFSEAKNAGLISEFVPIFDDDGKPDSEKLEKWNPYADIRGVQVSQSISKFSMATIIDLNYTFKDIFQNSGVTTILSGEDLVVKEGEQSVFGNSLVTVKTNRGRSTLYIYPTFHQYMTTPVIPEIPGRRKGISISTYATLKALGHVLFNKMTSEGEMELIGRFFNSAGWEKDNFSGQKGSYLGRKNLGSYYRDSNETATEIEKFSPIDDFADSYAQMLCHRMYFSKVCSEKSEVMLDIFQKYGIS